jgi:hypothetical protein
MDEAPPDLSTCQSCGRAVPPANNPEFARWEVTKNEAGKVSGMLCPNCQAAAGSQQDETTQGS